MTRTYRSEFPTFDPATLPNIPEGWEDVSWKNEPCPTFRAAGVIVYVDFLNPADREYGEGERFSVHALDDDGCHPAHGGGYLFSTDIWETVTAFVAGLAAFRATGRDVDDLEAAGCETGRDVVQPGRLYGAEGDGLFLERDGDAWTCSIGNTEGEGSLAELEASLYLWARDEGYFDDDPAEREALAREYVARIGYDPFADDPRATVAEVRQTLAEHAEAGGDA